MAETLSFAGHELQLEASGLIHIPAEQTTIVADLHLEKGSAFARRGTMLPPYDSQATLERLGAELERLSPKRVISLGDGFHDTAGARLITGKAHDRLLTLASRYDWLWIKGNHDHELPTLLPGTICDDLDLGDLRLSHEPQTCHKPILVGHLHPKARVRARRRSMSRPCFAWNRQMIIMPAFGSFTGGLNVLEEPVRQWLPQPQIGLLGEEKLYIISHQHLVPEPGSLGHVHQLA